MHTLLRTLFILCLSCLLLPQAFAQTKQEADEAYRHEQYQKAAQLYEQLLEKEENAHNEAIYYNLGNAYYRLDSLPGAVLNYERVLKLNPAHKHAALNLSFVQRKLADQITPESEMFFVTWTHELASSKTADAWAGWVIGCSVLFFLAVAVFLFGRQVWLRKTGFFSGLFFLLVTIVCHLFGQRQKEAVMETPQAVVMVPQTEVKATPADNGTKAFELHSGTTVTITDHSMKEWREIKLADGRTGWLRTEAIEEV